MFAPTSIVRLLTNVDLTNSYENTFSWTTESAQSSFFIGKSSRTFTDFHYVRKEKVLKVPINIESIWNVNYMMFQNADFGTKWFYAFITDLKFVNDTTTEISFEIDVLQTWYFEMDLKDCYIEREHVSNDAIGSHLVEENLNVGEYVTRSVATTLDINDLALVISTSAKVNANDTISDVRGGTYTGIYSGLVFVGFDANNDTAINDYIQKLDDAGKGNAINNLFLMPKALINGFVEGEVIFAPNALALNYSHTKNTTNIDGYIPKNNKLFTYPYNFLYISNHNGGFATYKYEYSTDINMEFSITGDISPSPTVYIRPKNYKGEVLNFEEALTLGNYPLCNWVNDIYANWLAQNVVSAPLGVLTSGLSLGVGITTGNPIAIAGGAIGVANSIGSFVEKSIQPNQAKGASRGGGNTAVGIQTFGVYAKTIRSEFAKIIDDYFTRFGYKVNTLKTPSFKTRVNWNYLKMNEVNIFGNIPNVDLKRIHEIFMDGLTFWHNDNVGNYNRSNAPI